MARIDNFLKYLDAAAVSAKVCVDETADKLKEFPGHTLQWADDVYDAAAKYDRYMRLAETIRRLRENNPPMTSSDLWTHIKEWVHKEMIIYNNRHHRSTSVSANLYAASVALVMTQLYEKMEAEWEWED